MKIDLQSVKRVFSTHGLIFIGSSKPVFSENDQNIYSQWLTSGKNADMEYLKRNEEVRRDIQRVMPGTLSILSFGLPYKRSSGDGPRIAGYAKIHDYHKTMKTQARNALEALIQSYGDLARSTYRICVDSAPIAERSYAAGVRRQKGFIGKSSMFIHREYGTFILLGEILIDRDLDFVVQPAEHEASSSKQKQPRKESCGTCKRCQVHCPTGALSEDYQVDSRRCLSYWTIEHRGLIPVEYWPYLAKYWYGCDICQDVCPFNRTIHASKDHTLLREHLGNSIDLFSIVAMSQHEYEKWFGGTAMTRAKREGLRRNALIALWATKDSRLGEALRICFESGDTILIETAHQMQSHNALPS